LELNYRITARLFWALFCGLTFLAFCSDLFQNETGFVKGLDSQANVLLERRAAVVSTQSQRRSRKKWWFDTAPCVRAVGGRTGALLSENIGRTVKRLHVVFLTT
jgi:hypothetical protein